MRSGWLQVGRPRCQSSSTGRDKDYHFSVSSRWPLQSTQLSIQRVPGALHPGLKRPGRKADLSPPNSGEVEDVDLYIHSTIRLHGRLLS
jgi:hypothetical protein